MVKEHKRKRSVGIPKYPKPTGRPGEKIVSQQKMAVGELRILFYLKNRLDGAQKSDLDTLVGHNYVRDLVCKNLEKNNFIRRGKTGKRSYVYKITDEGKEVCKYLLNTINEKYYEIGWFRLIKEIRDSSMKDVEV